MRGLAIVLGILALVVIQMKVLPSLSIGGIKPDFFLLFVCLLSLWGGETKGAIVGFCLGLLEDSLSLSPLGMRAFSFALVGFLLGFARRGLLLDSLLVQGVLLLSAGVLSGFVTLLALNFFLIPRPIGETLWRLILPETLLTACCGLLFLIFLQRWRRARVG